MCDGAPDELYLALEEREPLEALEDLVAVLLLLHCGRREKLDLSSEIDAQ